MALHTVKTGEHVSYEEFRSLPEQPGLQLIDGQILKEPSPTYGHQARVGRLHARMLLFVESHDLGRVIVAPFDVILGEQVLQPDVMFVRRARVGHLRDDGLYGAPDLVVEVLSPSTRRYDVGRKRELYFEHGCQEMWLVDVAARTVRQLTRRHDTVSDAHLSDADTLETGLLPGFSLSLGELFAS